MMTNLVVGTDVDDVDPIVGLETYYEASASGYDGYGVATSAAPASASTWS